MLGLVLAAVVQQPDEAVELATEWHIVEVLLRLAAESVEAG